MIRRVGLIGLGTMGPGIAARLARGDGFCDNVLLLGYGEPSMALPRQVHGADRADLQQYLGHLTDADMRRLDAALRSALGL